METLYEIGKRHGTDKGTVHRYTLDVYPRYMEPLRNQPVRLLELGILNGASLRMWSEYFTHPRSEIIGVDNWDVALQSDVGRARKVWCDFSMKTAIEDLRELGKVDVIIDDGPHVPVYQHSCFEILWPQLAPGGIYVIEDLQCGWDDKYLRKFHAEGRGTAMDWLQPKIERLMQGQRPKAHTIQFMHFHSECVVIGKWPRD